MAGVLLPPESSKGEDQMKAHDPFQGRAIRRAWGGNSRPFFLVAVILGALGVARLAQSATPASAPLTHTSGGITYSSGRFIAANPTPVPEVDAGPECDNPVQPCDDYAL